jgi:ADP-ribose pyrophosphatase
MTEKWTSLDSRELLRVGNRLRVSEERVRLPDGREVNDFLQFTTPAFATILAALPDGRILCERQYKHGPRRVILTLPAGALEAGEDPLTGARRELLEETGYVSDEWTPLGGRVTHANAGGGVTHGFLARNCRKVAEPNSGDLEDMTIEIQTPADILAAFADGQMALASDAAALLPGLMALGVLTLR